VQEIEKEAERRLREERERKRRALGHEARLQAVEAAARASIDTQPGNSSITGEAPPAPASGQIVAGGTAGAFSERDRVAAAAHAAAQTYDPWGQQEIAAKSAAVDVNGERNNTVCSALIDDTQL
jgi:hypothetical protein